jgi:hypothetical protein
MAIPKCKLSLDSSTSLNSPTTGNIDLTDAADRNQIVFLTAFGEAGLLPSPRQLAAMRKR